MVFIPLSEAQKNPKEYFWRLMFLDDKSKLLGEELSDDPWLSVYERAMECVRKGIAGKRVSKVRVNGNPIDAPAQYSGLFVFEPDVGWVIDLPG